LALPEVEMCEGYIAAYQSARKKALGSHLELDDYEVSRDEAIESRKRAARVSEPNRDDD